MQLEAPKLQGCTIWQRRPRLRSRGTRLEVVAGRMEPRTHNRMELRIRRHPGGTFKLSRCQVMRTPPSIHPLFKMQIPRSRTTYWARSLQRRRNHPQQIWIPGMGEPIVPCLVDHLPITLTATQTIHWLPSRVHFKLITRSMPTKRRARPSTSWHGKLEA